MFHRSCEQAVQDAEAGEGDWHGAGSVDHQEVQQGQENHWIHHCLH